MPAQISPRCRRRATNIGIAMPCAESKLVQPPFAGDTPAPSVPIHSAPSGADCTESTGRPFQSSGGEMVSRLFGRITTSPAPLPHHKFFSRSSHKEITQSEGNPFVCSKCNGGAFVCSAKNSQSPSPEVPPANAPEEVSARFATTSQPHGATPKSATHSPSFHFRIRCCRPPKARHRDSRQFPGHTDKLQR